MPFIARAYCDCDCDCDRRRRIDSIPFYFISFYYVSLFTQYRAGYCGQSYLIKFAFFFINFIIIFNLIFFPCNWHCLLQSAISYSTNFLCYTSDQRTEIGIGIQSKFSFKNTDDSGFSIRIENNRKMVL